MKKYFRCDKNYIYSMSLRGGQKKALDHLQVYKLLRIGKNCRPFQCTNKGGHRDVFFNKRREVGWTEFVVPVNSQVDLTFERSENVTLIMTTTII